MARLWVELIGLFILVPVAVMIWAKQLGGLLMPLLGFVGVVCLAILLADKQFKRIRLWHWEQWQSHIKDALRLFIPWACLLAMLVYLLKQLLG